MMSNSVVYCDTIEYDTKQRTMNDTTWYSMIYIIYNKIMSYDIKWNNMIYDKTKYSIIQ